MRQEAAWGAVCAILLSGGVSARGQNLPATLEQRLAALEQRVDQLERENQELRDQVARVLPGTEAERVEVVSAQSVPGVTAVSAPIGSTPLRSTAAISSSGLSALPPAGSVPPQQVSAEGKVSDRLEIGGQIRFRGEVRQNGDLSSTNADARDFVAQRLRFHVRTKLSDRVETFLQFQDSRLWGQEASTTSNDNLVDLHQGYLHVDDFLRRGLYFRAGRQEFIYGAERLVGAFGWDNIGRSFDALKMGYTSKSWSSDWFAAKTVDRGTSARDFDRAQYLYGIYNQFWRQKPQHLEAYGLFFRDGQRATGEIPGAGRGATGIMTVGLRSDGKIKPGIDYDLEFANQFGHRGFDSHSARAFAAKFYKTLEETYQFRLGFEYDVATGDSDPTDGRSGEFFNLFPTNHGHYGYADLMGWRNMQDFRPMLTFKPAGSLKFDFDYHRFYLLEARGPWKNAGGAVLGFDPAGQSGTHVGDELDFTLGFPLYKNLKILSGYALFLPGEFAERTRGQNAQHFFYAQTLVDF